ncbi:penicillin binding protein PBP4B [Peribacillus frigoritolerans]|uniref:penicillin binding protein PBP4B n=1 Tax=Peribacillus frigoritolerans TaxID=450367 RepID=UPI00105949FD|nr:penicillin binding protein PBP4B [Peribacillus frigoritolerans]TDL80308.1 penicillin binding protein PBP4B [Peribacillus frigoritolerans]
MKKWTSCALTSVLAISLLAPSASFAEPNEKDSPQAHVQYPVLTKAKKPEEAGFSSEKLEKVDQLIEKEVAAGFPGAALIVIKDGKIVKNESYGYKQKFDGHTPLKKFLKMENDTLFDLASNTKMYAANFALQKLASEGKLDIHAKVQDYIPGFKDTEADVIKGKDTMRIIDVLHHTAGFKPDPQYHNPAVSKELYSQEREKTIENINKTPLTYVPGTQNIYSDVDYMLLGTIVEKITGQKLDDYVENELYKPLKLKNTVFNPLQKGFKPKNIAATELLGNTRDGVINFPNIRTYTLQGEVHDEKAFYSMEGVSGHAGLFSTTSDLAVLLQVMLNGGGYGNEKLFDQEVIEEFVEPSDMNGTYGLGWRLNGNDSMDWMFSKYASDSAYGHTGWTGTVTIIDPEQDLGIVLLTNKKHSPLVNPAVNSNQFFGDLFTTGSYGSVVTAIYEALESNH